MAAVNSHILSPQFALSGFTCISRNQSSPPVISSLPSCSRRVAPGASSFNFSNVGFSLSSENLIGFRAARTSGRVSGGGKIRNALFPFLQKKKDKEKVKKELLDAIAPLERGAEASEDDIARVDKIAQELEAVNPTKDPLKSPLLSGKWKLIYTTSSTILKKQRPKALRPNGPIYQAINTDTLRAQNVETWPYFNQVTANLEPVNSKKVVVKFDFFKIAGLISVKAPGRARGELEITYLDENLRSCVGGESVSRGDKGNLFVLLMDDPSYRVPL